MTFFFSIVVAVLFVWLLHRIINFKGNVKSEKHILRLKLIGKDARLVHAVFKVSSYEGFHYFDFCMDEVIRLFLDVVKSTKTNKATRLYLFDYCKYAVKDEYNIFPVPVNSVQYHKLKANVPKALQDSVHRRIGSLPPLTEDMEIQLYARDALRWQRVLDKMTEEYRQGEEQQFYAEVIKIAALNESSEARQRNAYYKGYNFLAPKDKKLSLKLYVHYLHTGLKDFKHKDIGKRNKQAFFDKDKERKFELICKKMRSNGDLDKALCSVDEMYAVKRRTIKLDETAIAEARNEHTDVVNILDRYLSDNDVDLPATNDKTGKISQSTLPVIDFPKVSDSELLQLFAENNLQLDMQDLSNFADQKGIFKNQLIDSINKKYYELLDDVLIEEGEGVYTIEKEYFRIVSEPKK